MTVMPMLQAEKPIVRSLEVLVPLIKEDLRQGGEAAKNAAMPYYAAAGEKMLEAKGQMAHGEFGAWIKRNFGIASSQAARYMSYAHATSSGQISRARKFASLNAFLKETGDKGYMPNKPRPQPWHEPVKEAIGRVNIEALHQENLKRAEERELQRKLALQLIDIGYRALASKLHPDKGGSREAMSRLNAVRNRLKATA